MPFPGSPSSQLRAVVKDDAGDVGTPVGLLLALTYSADHKNNVPFDRLWVGGTGNINIKDLKNQNVLLSAVPVGMLNVQGKRVLSTSTTATDIVAVND